MKTSNTQKEKWGFEIGDGVNLDNIKISQLLTNVNHITNHLHNTKKKIIFFSLPPICSQPSLSYIFPPSKKIYFVLHIFIFLIFTPHTNRPLRYPPTSHQTVKPLHQPRTKAREKKFQFPLQPHQKKQKKEGNKAAATPPPYNSSSTRHRTIRTVHPFFRNASSSTGIKSCLDYSTTQV